MTMNMLSGKTADLKIDKAIKALQSQRMDDAVLLLKQACQKNKYDPRPWLLLSSAYGQKGDMQEVIRCAKQVLTIIPDHCGALKNLGNAYAHINDHQLSVQYYQAALRQSPGDPDLLISLGNVLMCTGQLEKALEHFRQATHVSPDNHVAHSCLAQALLEGGRTQLAINHFNAALRLMPDLPPANRGLGMAYLALGELSLAEKHYHKALAAGDAHHATFSGYAFTLHHLGRATDAIAVLDRALAVNPRQINIIQAKAAMLERHGRYKEAFDLLSELEERAIDPTSACVLTRLSKRFDFSEKALQIVDKLLHQSSLLPVYRKKLYFAKAHLLDELERYDEAFEYFRKANDTTKPYFDFAKCNQHTDRLIATFSTEKMALLSKATNLDPRPIFIIGMPRSGTTLVEQILCSHPGIYGGGELYEIPNLIHRLCGDDNKSYPEVLLSKGPEERDRLALEYLHKLGSMAPEASRITDKLPHNFLHLGLIQLLFPKATVIHCKRHPFDTCLSIYFQDFVASHTYASNFEDIGRYYLEYDRLMHHWEQTLVNPMITIQYEALVADQEGESRRLIDHCGLEWDDRCLDFHQHRRVNTTSSYNQVSRKMYKSSVERWRHYEPYIFPLRDILSPLLQKLSG